MEIRAGVAVRKRIEHLKSFEVFNSIAKINQLFISNTSHNSFKELLKLKKKISKKIKGHVSFEYDPDKKEPLTFKIIENIAE